MAWQRRSRRWKKAGPRQNLIGPAIQRIRRKHMLTQAALALKCCESGFELGPTEVAKIECGVRCVTDVEIAALARVLAVESGEFFLSEPVIEESNPVPKGLLRARPLAKKS